MRRRVGAVLVHYPVLDRDGRTVTSAITNLDLHDISRSARTYGLCGFYVVHPVAAQRELALKVREHWLTGSGGRRIPDRMPAMELLHVVSTLEEALSAMGEGTELWTTSAQRGTTVVDYATARLRFDDTGPSVLLCFGTGWGLAQAVYERASVQLEPIGSAEPTGFNHLSVRAAAAITFDRLFGAR